MQQGIGIRYSSNGIRVVGLRKTETGIEIVSVASGAPARGIENFLTENGFTMENNPIVVGLCPGDFLSSCINGTAEMTLDEINEVLNWEINRKIISGVSEYSMDFLNLENSGMLFATRNNIITTIKGELPGAVIDVEPIALFNSWEASGYNNAEPVLLISAEAEGICSVAIENALPVSVESIAVQEKEISAALVELDYDSIYNQPNEVAERYLNYIRESILRLTSLGPDKTKITPSKILITGGAAYFGKPAKIIGNEFNIPAEIFDPFGKTVSGIDTLRHEYQELKSAFTTPAGFALRAMAE